MSWQVGFKKKAAKQVEQLDEPIRERLAILLGELEKLGPVRGNWKNYSKLDERRHHCHIKSGHPTYVVCWEVTDKKIKILEIYYVGTHEKAPY